MRQIVFDTETTGLEPELGHRIIEIGAIELVNRRRTGRQFHRYLCPDREIDPGAVQVHGLTTEFLGGQPRFAEVCGELREFIAGAELVIHTLALVRQMHPGQRNGLDALCKRYSIDNSHRDLHGALLDADLLLEVYLAMTGGQGALTLDDGAAAAGSVAAVARAVRPAGTLLVRRASAEEAAAHETLLQLLDRKSGGRTEWRRFETAAGAGVDPS
jgi:DNA polymerase III subunit epsilon